MRIAQVATLYESVPPRTYGGIERVVSWLTEELVRQGHAVTLFASGDSVTTARHVATCERALRDIEQSSDPQAFHFAMLEQVVRRSREFDLVHFHTDYQSFPFARRLSCAHVTTLHWRLDIPGLAALYREFADVPLVAISQAQRSALPDAGWAGTVHHGMPDPGVPASAPPGDYLAFVGRIAPQKGPDLAIEIARRAALPLVIAAKIDHADQAYANERIVPLMREPSVHYVGELNDADKFALLARARGMLFPVDWPEPFGLVMIEALACGTPVIAYRRGSVEEVIEHGKTGFIVDSLDAAVDAVSRLGDIDRRRCRAAFRQRFSVTRMSRAYVDIYERLWRAHAARRHTHAWQRA
jgi:glycosyltransferase involved in cell wall biosynthesis